MDSLEDILNKWGEQQVAEAVLILQQANVSSTGTLADSIRVEFFDDTEGIGLNVLEVDYGKFVREGVQGSESNLKAPNSPFKFKTKMPPSQQIDAWVVKKGLQGVRDSQGRFIKRKSLVFAIRRSIFKFGIRPINYMSPFFKNINELQGDITENQKRDILLLLESALNESTQ